MRSESGKQTFAIQILPSISRSKEMKFGQLTEYKGGETFFLKNRTQNVVMKLFLDLFPKNPN